MYVWYGVIANIYSNETYERARKEQLIQMKSKQNSVMSLTLKSSIAPQPLATKGVKKIILVVLS